MGCCNKERNIFNYNVLLMRLRLLTRLFTILIHLHAWHYLNKLSRIFFYSDIKATFLSNWLCNVLKVLLKRWTKKYNICYMLFLCDIYIYELRFCRKIKHPNRNPWFPVYNSLGRCSFIYSWYSFIDKSFCIFCQNGSRQNRSNCLCILQWNV